MDTFREKERWLSLGMWTVLCICCMVVMLCFTATKTITVADVSRDESSLLTSRTQGQPLIITRGEDSGRRLCIPLKTEWKADQVTIENRYMDRELWIYIEGSDKRFYLENAIVGDTGQVLSGSCEVQPEGMILKLEMSGILEYRSILEENYLYIEYYHPREQYERIVVIDPACGGTDSGITVDGYAEKDMTLEVARRLKKKLDKTDIKVYYTRLEDIDVEPAKRAAIANELDADCFVSIRAAGDEEQPGLYGVTCLYNGAYFIPELNNVDLADVLAHHVAVSVSGRAAGLTEAGEDAVLSLLEVPGTAVQVGYMTNPLENELLRKEAYLDKVSDGIAAGIQEIYER